MSDDQDKALKSKEADPGHDGAPKWTFPAWYNKVPAVIFLVVGPVATIAVLGAVWYYFSPEFTDVGYRPVQPVEYSHKLHAGDLGIDCRYCHTGVERGMVAGVPPTQTCMNCHSTVKTDSPKLLKVRQSWASGESIPWVRIHKTPDYAYFDHSAHANATIGCESCHGRIDQMERVTLEKSLSMGWCVDCHRAPEQHLRPKSELTTMGYKPAGDQLAIGNKIKAQNEISPPLHCSGCHR